MKMSRTAAAIVLLLTALTLAACVSLRPTKGNVLSTRPEQRYTDELIQRDWHAIETLTARLEARQKDLDAYAAYKAGFLIEFAIDEYHENDRSGVITWALDSARDLVAAPDRPAQREIALRVPRPGRYDEIGLLVMVAEEHRFLMKALEQTRALEPCAAEALARYYVGVMSLAHERWEVTSGLVKGGHENEMLERLATRRGTLEAALRAEASENCVPVTPPPFEPPKPPRGHPPRIPLPQPPLEAALPKDVSRGNVLFEYDGYTQAETLPGARENVAQAAQQWRQRAAQLKAAGSLPPMPIKVVAHTDRIGSYSYNHRLSWRRAQTVRAMLIREGIPADRIEIDVMAFVQPVARCQAEEVDAQYINCLGPDRRVEILLPFTPPAAPDGRR